ncbi:DUF429 domain-containing protein [Petrachloros mirabilis]
MSRRRADNIVVGVDVGGLKKGFHAVALRRGCFLESYSSHEASEVVKWCRTLNASAIGIDAPCSWSRTGRARLCERELARQGIFTFATPNRSRGEKHPFYRWMCNGAEFYRLLAPHYRLFDGKPPTIFPVCFETFPQAVACALAGRILPAKNKRADRPRLLRKTRLALDSFTNIDLIDAALCALTARYLLAGSITMYGDAEEGFIVVPAC